MTITNDSSSNASRNGNKTSNMSNHGELVGWIIGFTVVDILIIVSNIITIAVFTRSKLLRKHTNYFLLSLAVADIMIGAISLPLFLHTLMAWVQSGLGDLNSWVETLSVTFDIFSGFASVFTLTIISLERLYSVALPNWHRTTPSYVYCLLVALIWTLASVIVCLRILFDIKIIDKIVLFYVVIVTFFVCLVVICMAYIGIFIKVKRRKHEKTKKALEKDKRLAMTLLFVTTIFIITWLPFQAMNIIISVCGDDCIKAQSDVLFNIIYFTKLMQYINSFVNPVIYTFKMPDFKRALFTIFGTRSHRTNTKASSRIINGRRKRASTLRSSESEPIRQSAV